MQKKFSLDLVKTRYRNPQSKIVEPVRMLTQEKFGGPGSSATGNEKIFFSENPAGEFDFPEATALPTKPILISGSTHPDSIGHGQVVEEFLPRFGNSFLPTLQVKYFRQVWFDGLEAYFGDHYSVDIGINTLTPDAVLLGGTEVLVRYVVK
jgi:hypothetical protein